jgi:hypothetical protein
VVRSSVGSVLELGVRKFGGWTKLFGCANHRVARRSEPLDPGTGESLDQNSMELSCIGSSGFERSQFQLQEMRSDESRELV